MADSKNLMTATDDNFENDVLQADKLTVVDFSAEWCGPCKMLAPTISALADEYAGQVKFYKMDVDQNPSTPSRFHIRGVPTVIFFKGGEMVDQMVGNQPRQALIDAIQKHL